jgi:hypothetical protein
MVDSIKRCIFCERTDLNREHVWPMWMHELIRKEGFGRHVRKLISTSPSNPNVSGEKFSIERQGAVTTVRLKVVCKNHCNGGWMSRLETKVIPILSPLLLGHPFVLGKYHQEILATWIAMKLLVCECSVPEDVVTPSLDRSLVMGRRLPPDIMKIWIGYYQGSFWQSAYERHAALIGWGDASGPLPLPKGTSSKNIQSQTLGIGRFLVQAISTTLGGLDFHSPKLPHNPLRQLWPYERNIVWPTGQAIPDPQVRIIASGLDQFTRRLPFSPGNTPRI